jgi:CBS domain-containing protein
MRVNPVMTVRDVMTTSVITADQGTPLKDVARLLVEHGISGIPVCDANGRVVGVVSEADLVLKGTGPEALPHRPLARVLGDSRSTRAWRAKIDATTAEEAMTSPAVTISPSATIAEAARIMTDRKVNRLVVVDGERLAGIITRADLVRAYVRSDEELAETIRDEVLLRILWVDPSGFRVEVTRGVATVTGHVDRRSMAEVVESAIAMVPGIVRVNADITWSMDDSQIKPPTADAFFPFSPR